MIASAEAAPKLACFIRSTAVDTAPCLGHACAAWRWVAGPGVPWPGQGGSVNGRPPPSPERPMGCCGLVGEPSANHLRVAGLLAGRAGLALRLPAAQYAKATPPPPSSAGNDHVNDRF
jgi:hypothetical protein